MKKLQLKIYGIHDCNRFAQKARLVDGDVTITRGKYCLDGKSILGIFSIDTSQGFTVEYPEDAKDFEDFIMQFVE